jgi:HAD superfamily hydrolase (TIGR01509 family)
MPSEKRVSKNQRQDGERSGVLVDVDGTLLDTNYLHTIAWMRAFRSLGEWAPMNAIHRLVGMGGDQLVPKLFGREIDGADRAHAEHWAELKDEMRVFPGAPELLRRIHESGLAVVLATSAPAKDAAEMRARLRADDAIDAVVHGDDVERSKPAPDIFAAACTKARIDRTRVLVVGDSIWDIEAARAARMACIAVESGGFSKHELTATGAIAVYKDVQELGDQLLTSPLAHLVNARPRA